MKKKILCTFRYTCIHLGLDYYNIYYLIVLFYENIHFFLGYRFKDHESSGVMWVKCYGKRILQVGLGACSPEKVWILMLGFPAILAKKLCYQESTRRIRMCATCVMRSCANILICSNTIKHCEWEWLQYTSTRRD